ncbi:MAG: FkbM family methyltransferase [Gammaproteobacteria bacterium]
MQTKHIKHKAMELWQGISYFIARFILRRSFLTAYSGYATLKFRFKTEDALGRSIYKRGHFEKQDTDFLLNQLEFNAGDIIFDVGANIGWYSLIFDKMIDQAIKIYAFEPDPLNFQLLNENIRANRAEKISAIPKAVAETETDKLLYRYSNNNLGRHSLLPINNDEGIRIASTRLDHFISQQNIDMARIKFMKIDIEGYEYKALLGAQTLLQKLPCIFSEYAPPYMQKGGLKPTDFIHLLLDYHYQPYLVTQGQLKPVNIDTLLKNTEIINLFWQKKAA